MADAISPQALSELIGSIYDCALDPSRWEQTLANVMDALESHVVTLNLSDLRHDRFLINKTIGMSPDQLELQSKHLPEVHALLREALALRPSLDEPHVMSRHIPTAYIETSPY